MIDYESLLQQCCNYVLPQFIKIAESSSNVMTKALTLSQFPEDLLRFQWDCLKEISISDSQFDSLIDLVMRKCVSDTLLSQLDTYDSLNELDSMRELEVCATLMDFCFYSKDYRRDKTAWFFTCFDVFSSIMDLLTWPHGVSDFWSYPMSRIDWFQMGNMPTEEYNGVSNLISYKAPLAEKLRHWNSFLEQVEASSFRNSPLHYKMKFELIRFISMLLPINEESNFNRSAQIAGIRLINNPWNATGVPDRPRTPHEVFANDYRCILDKFLTNPIDFILKPLQYKLNIEKALHPLFDAIFDVEEEFYKNMKSNYRKVTMLNAKLNSTYEFDYTSCPKDAPCYVRTSETMCTARITMWKDIAKFTQQNNAIVRATMLDMSISNPELLYKQITTLDSDFFRKEFLLQICFVCRFIERLMNSEDAQSFFRNSYERENRQINFNKMEEPNLKKCKALCNYLYEMRILKFYHTRDLAFYEILRGLLESDDEFLDAKIDNFRAFANLRIPKEPEHEEKINESFKKFGFFKLGNKYISNIWKIETGTDNLKSDSVDADELFSRLEEEYKDGSGVEDTDKIVKQWQQLRSLRTKYMMDFDKFNETTGMSGFFDPGVASSINKERSILKERLMKDINKTHTAKLAVARAYFEGKRGLKNARDENTGEKTEDEPAVKRVKLEDDKEGSASGEAGVSEKETADNEAQEARSAEIASLPAKSEENVEEEGDKST